MRRLDLLTWPLLGPFLKWRHARTALQIPIFALAALVVFDGLAGPQLAPKNLATVSVWLHYRGLVVLALLIAGNLFCMACPFMLPRRAGRWLRERLFGGGRPVPAGLRKWLAIGLLVVFFYCYELFNLWASPWLTAWLILGYFLAAFTVDTCFRGAAFCKHVCPVGQFNFFGSLVSPLEIKTRRPATCAACRTKDCITASNSVGLSGSASQFSLRKNTSGASRAARDSSLISRRGAPPAVDPLRVTAGVISSKSASYAGARGCELWLFQPRKSGNMDCTFCLDCVHACPYDNIGLIGRTPTSELWTDPFRSGIGRFSRRGDLVALVLLFSFGAFINAFAMIKPVYGLQAQLARWLGTAARAPGLAIIFLVGLVLLPALLVTTAGMGTRLLSRSNRPPVSAAIGRYAYALVPMGFGMWLAHYAFHFLTGGLTIVPVVQSFLADIGLFGSRVRWGLGPLVPTGWLYPIEAVLLYCGATGSLIAAFQIARDQLGDRDPGARQAVLRAALPWALLVLLMLAAGLWILVQPMEMRGTMMLPAPSGG
jgi:ferredoxin